MWTILMFTCDQSLITRAFGKINEFDVMRLRRVLKSFMMSKWIGWWKWAINENIWLNILELLETSNRKNHFLKLANRLILNLQKHQILLKYDNLLNWTQFTWVFELQSHRVRRHHLKHSNQTNQELRLNNDQRKTKTVFCF